MCIRDSSNRRPQACAPAADDQYIVLVALESVAQKSLTSRIAPLATGRTYGSASPTEIKLDHASSTRVSCFACLQRRGLPVLCPHNTTRIAISILAPKPSALYTVAQQIRPAALPVARLPQPQQT